MKRLLAVACCVSVVCCGCFLPLKTVEVPPYVTLDRKYERMKAFIGEAMYGKGGLEVLTVAYKALREKRQDGEAGLVGLEDLWAHALKEGRDLFNKPDKLWGKTTAEETRDMLGQTTIGPWQMTIQNVREIYGPPYGVRKEWTNAQAYGYVRAHPEIQAKMIIDYIQKSYEDYGLRGPYAIQRYFWLEAYVKGEIGQGDWQKSPVAVPPEGDWRKLTPEMKRDTGFYAKQILLGSKFNQYGLLFWLYVTKDTPAIEQTLWRWKQQQKCVWQNDRAVVTQEPGKFVVPPEDVIYPESHPHMRAALRSIARKVYEGR
jgi:hypothetical protein